MRIEQDGYQACYYGYGKRAAENTAGTGACEASGNLYGAKDVAALIEKAFGVKVEIGEPGSIEELKQSAAQKPAGIYVQVSKKYLEKIGRSKETMNEAMNSLGRMIQGLQTRGQLSCAQGRSVVAQGLAIGEDGSSMEWISSVENKREKLTGWGSEENQPLWLTQMKEMNQKKKGKSKSPDYNAGELISLLQVTRDSLGLRHVVSKAFNERSALLQAQATGEYDTNAVKQALAHVNKLIRCARKKISHLSREQRMQSQQKAAAKQKQEREIQAQKREWERQKRIHQRKEERDIDDLKKSAPSSQKNPQSAEAAFRQAHEAYTGIMDTALSGGVDMALPAAVMTGGTVGVSVAAAAVSVTVSVCVNGVG